MLEPAQIADVAAFAASLSGIEVDPARGLRRGRTLFAENCAACHGDDGKGNRELGAPDLTDAITLYVHSEADIAAPGPQSEAWRHAGLGCSPGRGQREGTGRLCSFAWRRRVGAGAVLAWRPTSEGLAFAPGPVRSAV